MKEDIWMIRSSAELNKEEGKKINNRNVSNNSGNA